MLRKFNFIILSSICLTTPVFAMEGKKYDWLRIVKSDARSCQYTITNNPSKQLDFVGLTAAIRNTADYGTIKLGDKDINPVVLDDGKEFFGLHVAAQFGSVYLVEAYLRHSVDTQKRGPDGQTPLEIARTRAEQASKADRPKFTTIIELLEARQKDKD